eukprot:1910712-Pyramimonas_sp.AAC.1
MSAAEATLMDPQQRMAMAAVLEVSIWRGSEGAQRGGQRGVRGWSEEDQRKIRGGSEGWTTL